ncbi:hypothetical protein D8674_041493 [Pyrus ussuriensis x Pyrus communis]|uniref:Uncharacterized protein n=1 Tax=Pyrus ussuriensis x Pyrus communis TaxID=2448454 RepID=A0A5N5G3G6_9ROSA|nr:hypothetical protein D8674_041493 [Pyrus ussuriensis x Pyrus communis]
MASLPFLIDIVIEKAFVTKLLAYFDKFVESCTFEVLGKATLPLLPLIIILIATYSGCNPSSTTALIFTIVVSTDNFDRQATVELFRCSHSFSAEIEERESCFDDDLYSAPTP